MCVIGGAPPRCTHAGGAWAQAGFTLVELLVVFAITALLVALAPLAFDRLQETAQYRQAVTRVHSDLRAARYDALAQGRPVSLTLDMRGRTWRINDRASWSIPESLTLRAVVAASELGDGRARIRFFPGGGATGGSIEIVRASGGGVRLRVDWLTGRVSQESLLP